MLLQQIQSYRKHQNCTLSGLGTERRGNVMQWPKAPDVLAYRSGEADRSRIGAGCALSSMNSTEEKK